MRILLDHVTALIGCLALSVLGCGERASQPSPAPPPPARSLPVAAESPPVQSLTLTFASFTTVREAYEKRIIPQFVDHWRHQHAQDIVFVQSYGGSGKQAQAIEAGMEADVAALSHAEDVRRLVQAGLVRHDWEAAPHAGVVSRSVVVIGVRKGNPLGIRDWVDLLRPGLGILTPDPTTSGGGKWNVAAIYGAARRGTAGIPSQDAADAERFLAGVLANIIDGAPDARGSFKDFESGRGDVAITSESEVMRSRMFGHDCECVVPRSSLRMDNPAVVIDANVDKHGVRPIAEAFLEYLTATEAQRAFALRGLRPVDPEVAAEFGEQTSRVEDLWGIEAFGGWEQVSREVFGQGGVLERAQAAARQK